MKILTSILTLVGLLTLLSSSPADARRIHATTPARHGAASCKIKHRHAQVPQRRYRKSVALRITARKHIASHNNHRPFPRIAYRPKYVAPPSVSTSQFVSELRERGLLIPIAGSNPEAWKHSYYSPRGSAIHHAVDMKADTYTPILAVQDGIIARLTTSSRAGIALYQTDASKTYNFFYCHLQQYAAGIHAGQAVKRGQVIGYVGATGHASGPHLHFQISKIIDPDKLWIGIPINPYLVFANNAKSTIDTIAKMPVAPWQNTGKSRIPKKDIGLPSLENLVATKKSATGARSVAHAQPAQLYRRTSPSRSLIAKHFGAARVIAHNSNPARRWKKTSPKNYLASARSAKHKPTRNFIAHVRTGPKWQKHIAALHKGRRNTLAYRTTTRSGWMHYSRGAHSRLTRAAYKRSNLRTASLIRKSGKIALRRAGSYRT